MDIATLVFSVVQLLSFMGGLLYALERGIKAAFCAWADYWQNQKASE